MMYFKLLNTEYLQNLRFDKQNSGLSGILQGKFYNQI